MSRMATRQRSRRGKSSAGERPDAREAVARAKAVATVCGADGRGEFESQGMTVVSSSVLIEDSPGLSDRKDSSFVITAPKFGVCVKRMG